MSKLVPKALSIHSTDVDGRPLVDLFKSRRFILWRPEAEQGGLGRGIEPVYEVADEDGMSELYDRRHPLPRNSRTLR